MELELQHCRRVRQSPTCKCMPINCAAIVTRDFPVRFSTYLIGTRHVPLDDGFDRDLHMKHERMSNWKRNHDHGGHIVPGFRPSLMRVWWSSAAVRFLFSIRGLGT